MNESEQKPDLKNEYDALLKNKVHLPGYQRENAVFDFFYSIILPLQKENQELREELATVYELSAKTAESNLELEKELSDNRKVIASNGMTIGELRKEVERLKSNIRQLNHEARP